MTLGQLIEATQRDAHRAGYADAASDCLLELDTLPADDLARPDFRAAAVTFGLLAVADALTTSERSLPLADVVAIAGDVTP